MTFHHEEQLDLFGSAEVVREEVRSEKPTSEEGLTFKDCMADSSESLKPEPFFAIWVDALAQAKPVRRGRTRHTSISA